MEKKRKTNDLRHPKASRAFFRKLTWRRKVLLVSNYSTRKKSEEDTIITFIKAVCGHK